MIFTLDSAGCFDFFLLNKMKVNRELPPSNNVDDFKIKNKLKPTGLVLTVHEASIKIHNFDELLEKKTNSCHLLSSVAFNDSPKFKMASISDEQDLLLVLDEELGLTTFMLKNGFI